ncbi:hypothetical protein PpBr36_03271 [Pyricularia pennisetigena]|uniref:hypothetical protein n=1 Tax=Pyricularia pennisetigena TaxID=1578925 RepID=UPI0011528918|nr:hypothetical protein PpBr36_03271 [Pyricularia pennisetigena]TLS30126.1 hypothetical protein PpBr36_03271 [Pyricularia pennisetigena]
MQFNFIAITVALVVTSYAAEANVNLGCSVFSQGDVPVCSNKALPVYCDARVNDRLGAYGACCPDNNCGVPKAPA